MKGPSVLVTELRGVDNASGVYKKVGRAAADLQRSMDGMAGKLFDQVNAARMSTKEFDLYKASLMGLGRAEKQRISDMHDLISAEKQQSAAAAEQARQAALEAQLSEKREKNIQQVIQLLERERDMLKYNTRELHLRMAAQNGASEAQIRHINNLHDGIDAMGKTEKGGRNLNGTLRLMRGGFGQVGHQIQDIAVQLQMGTNAMLVFGQQGGQIASLFGPKGAMIGAVLSVGAAIGTYLAPKFFEGEKAAEQFREKVEDLASKTKELTSAQLEYLAVAYADKIEEQKERQKELQDQYADEIDLLEQLERQLGITAAGSEKFKMVSEQMQEIKDDTKGSIAEIEILGKEIKETSNKLEEIQRGGNPFYELESGANGLKMSLEDVMSAIDDYKESQLSASELVELSFAQSTLAIQQAMADQEISASEGSRLMIEVFRMRAAKIKEISDQEAVDLLKSEQDKMNQRVKIAKEEARKVNQAAAEAVAEFNERLSMISNLNQFKESLMSEEEQFAYSMLRRYQMLEEFRANDLVSETEYLAMKRALQEQEVEKQLNDQLRLINGFEGMKQIGVQAIGAIIKEGASMSDVFKMIGRTIVDNVIESFVDMGVEYVKQALVRQAIEKKGLGLTIATSVAAGKSMAAAYAPAAAMASLASFGGNAVPAQTGIATTVGVAKSLASFEGGGFTGSGARSGGIDGRGGFLSVLHPNETVIDHTKGQGQGITIVNNIDASGAGPEVDQKIVAAMEVTSQQTVKQVQDLLRRQRLV